MVAEKEVVLKELEEFYKNSVVGLRVGNLYVYKQYLLSDKAFCYCSNCNKNNIEISASLIRYWRTHHNEVTCGCSLKCKNEEKHSLKYGDSFSELTIVKKLPNKQYECLCKCKNLVVVDEKDLINNVITQCQDCENAEIKEKDEYYKDRIEKELYYIWNSYRYLYENPTKSFQKKILDKGFKFFEEYNNSFEMFYNWALQNNYRKGGAIYLERIDKTKGYTTDNSIWNEENKDKFIDLPQSVLKNSKEEVLQKGNLTRQKVELAKYESKKEVKEDRDNLFNYLYNYYGVKFIPESVQTLLKQLNAGTNKKYKNIQITYRNLLDMLKYYQKNLLSLYANNIKKGKCKTSNQRMSYDIAIIIDRLDDYANRKEVLYNQVNNNNFNSTVDLTEFMKPINKRRDEEAQKEFERIEEMKDFVKNELVNLDEDDE